MERYAISAARPAAGLTHSPALGAEHPGGAVAARHLPGLDLLRFASVVGLVWFHTDAAGNGVFGYAGLPAVLTISVALPVIHVGRRSPAEELIRRGRRLLLPWLFWSAFYGALAILGAARHRTPLAWGTPRDWFLIGTSIHLWYLPFALLATLVALVMQRALAYLLARYVCVIGALIGMATLILASLASRAWAPPSPFGQWAFGLAAIPFGLTIGTACRARESRVPYVLAGIACACAGACLVLDRLDDRPSALAYGLGVPLVCLAIPWRVRLNDPGRALVSLAMGIYLLHPFVLGQFHRVGLANLGVATAAAVTVATGSLTFLLQKTPIRRFL